MRINRTGGQGGFPEPFLGVAVEGPSREGFLLYPSFSISGAKGYANGDDRPHILPDGAGHTWRMDYAPAGSGAAPSVRVIFDGKAVSVNLDPAAVRSNQELDRFGIITTTTDGNGQVIYFDDLSYTVR